MARRAIACSLLTLSFTLPAQRNFDFEAGAGSDTVPGWFLPVRGFAAELQPRGKPVGGHCVRVAPRGGAARFGNFMQNVDARKFRGKHVRLRAEVRVGSRTSPAQLWMRVDRTGGKRGFFDNMGDRPITGTAWRSYEIIGEVADDATSIAIGMMVRGRAGAWLDNVELEVLEGVQDSKPEGPRALEGTALDNVVAFARLAGYVRHFHPSSEAREEDWNRFVIDGVREIEAAKTPRDLAQKLREIFAFVAPTVAIGVGRVSANHRALRMPAKPKGHSVVTWRHAGFGQSQGPVYKSAVEAAPLVRGPLDALVGKPKLTDMPVPAKPLRFALPRGLTCAVPLALYQKGERTLPHVRGNEREPRLLPPSAEDRATRLATVILAWNVFQHFYPYFDVVDVDWEAALPAALRGAATDAGPAAFLGTLREMVAKLEDGHGYVGHRSDPRTGNLPAAFAMAEGELVVDRVAQGTEGLTPGDVVVEIEGEPAALVLERLGTGVSAATKQFRTWRVLNDLRRGVRGEEVRLQVRDRSRSRSVVLKYGRPLSIPEARPAKIAELKPGVFYLDVSRIDDDEFRGAIQKLAKAKGIVFDFRGYPGNLGPHLLFSHLIDEPVQSAQWHIPAPRRPDRKDLTFHAADRWLIRPSKPRFEGELVFVTDGRAISYAESCMGIVEHYELGTIVGEATAGTNGNVNPLSLPGGYRIMWTGMKVLKHDGTRHHGVGILPTVPVQRTIAGIRAGRDEFLEKALELLK